MDLPTYRRVLALLGCLCLVCVLAVTILAIAGHEIPPVLAALAGTFGGAVAGALTHPPKPERHRRRRLSADDG
jgi:membrane associated rhomboid family serine protease